MNEKKKNAETETPKKKPTVSDEDLKSLEEAELELVAGGLNRNLK